MTGPRRFMFLVLLTAGVLLLALASLSTGKIWIPWSAWAAAANDPHAIIVFDLRLPRTILAIAVGMALGLSGAALQGYTRNPLADPGVLGVSSMAALGSVLTLYIGMGTAAAWVAPVGAMIGAVVGVIALLLLAGNVSSVLTFVLAGVILNTIAAAGVALALSVAPNPWAVNEIVNWLMGSLADRSFDEVRFALPFIAVGCVLLLLTSRALDALTLGETGARSLGIDMRTTRFLLAAGVGLAAGASVAVTGVIGFVGLITPHLLRPVVGARPGALLVPSMLAGAAIVLAADILVRLVPSAAEVKLGVATAAFGGPFFLLMLLAMRRKAL